MQKLQLSIPEPCHENWQTMTPTEQGRFCNSCAKEVIDFSMMTDTEVLNYFTTLTHEKVCGRALPAQLDRTITLPKEPKKRLFWYWNYIVMFLMFFAKSNMAKAQGGIKQITELNPFKPADVKNTSAYLVGDTEIASRIISGKVVDKDSNPVYFASIKIKGTNTGVSADANGAYSIKIKPNDILVISGASFKTVEVPVGKQSNLNTVMEKGNFSKSEIVISGMLGGISFRNLDDSRPVIESKGVAVLAVKDEKSGKAIVNASLIIIANESSKVDSVITDNKGMYKIKKIKEYDNYLIKISADGYESTELEIDGSDFNDRKKIWEVLLRKQKVERNKSALVIKPGAETRVMLGGIRFVKEAKGPIYVVDGTIIENRNRINTDDIEDIFILERLQAEALFGPDGSNGAIIITTKKLKEKTLDTVVVSSDFGVKKVAGTLGMVSISGMDIKKLNEKISPAVEPDISFKVYPNPVQRGNTIKLSLKFKQTGLHLIQITDANGRTIFYKRINTVNKEQNEMILCDSKWSAGLYYISLYDNRNKLVNKNSFIIQ